MKTKQIINFPLIGIWLFLALSAPLALTAFADNNLVLLEKGDVSGWEYQKFDDIAETDYQTQVDETLGHAVLLAHSQNGASGYTMERELDLQKTPWLHFLWRVDAVGDNPKEKEKAGDDFGVRLYFTGRSGLSYRTLNLAYAQTADIGAHWKSPYSKFISDIRVYPFARHQPENLNQWQVTVINVYDIWQELFDDDGEIGLVGLMSDGDSAALTMRARYGGIVLSDSPDPIFNLPQQQ